MKYAAPIVGTLSTLALAVITFFYLQETRAIRQLAARSFRAQTAPKVFLASISGVATLNEARKTINVSAKLQFMNTGGTEATNFSADYSISFGTMKKEGTFGPIPYLFPSQRVEYVTAMLTLTLNDRNFAVVREAQRTGRSIIPPEEMVPPGFLGLTLNYRDDENVEQKKPEIKYKYQFHTNSWVFLTE